MDKKSTESVETILKYFNSFDADPDPGSGMEKIRIRDPGWKKFGSGIRDKHPGSATLVPIFLSFSFESPRFSDFLIAAEKNVPVQFYELLSCCQSCRRVTFAR
jgi:hypothetical protein